MYPKTGWIIYRKQDIIRNQSFINKLNAAFTSFKIQIEIVAYEELSLLLSDPGNLFDSYPLGKPDFIVNRSVSPWINEVMELAGVRCFNSAYVARIANDKRLAHAVLSGMGIPMLESRAVHAGLFTGEGLTIKEPFILKDPIGRGGTGVELIDPSKNPAAIAGTLPESLLYQPVGGQKGKDLRVYIVGNTITGAVLRESATDFRANISTGGNASLYDLNEEETALINRITDRTHLDFAGLDFLISEDGNLLFNEMEDAVGSRSLYMNSSIDIAAVFAEYVKEEIGTD